MLIRLRDLRTLSARSEDGARHRVIDLLVRADAPDVTHVVTQLGGWRARQGCAIRMAAFGEPDLAQNEWPTAMGEADADAAGSGGAVAVLCAPDAMPEPADVARAEGSGPLAALAGVNGARVVGSCGNEAGSVMDAVIDTEGRRVAMLVLRTAGSDRGHQRVVPAETFEPWTGPRARCG